MDLLLTLISKNKLDIHDIQIFELVEQYLEYIGNVDPGDLDDASEFLEMAARLVHIKTVSLLPKHEEAQALGLELQSEIIEYHRYKTIAKLLTSRADFDGFVRNPAVVDVDMTYRLKHSPNDIHDSYALVLGRRASKAPPPEQAFYGIVKKRIVSVSSRIIFILRSAWRTKRIRYRDLFSSKDETSELVATFLAVLELVRGKRMRLEGRPQDPELRLIDGGEKR